MIRVYYAVAGLLLPIQVEYLHPTNRRLYHGERLRSTSSFDSRQWPRYAERPRGQEPFEGYTAVARASPAQAL